MGQDEGAARASAVTESKDPEQIREEIETTRQELGDTVEALAAKADVKGRVREKIGSTKDSAAEKLGKAREASPDSVSSAATQATATAKQNPIPVAALGAFAGGFLLGRVTKRSKRLTLRPPGKDARRNGPRDAERQRGPKSGCPTAGTSARAPARSAALAPAAP